MMEVEQVRPVRIRWHIMCLAILNAGNVKTDRYQKLMDQSLGVGRVVAAAARYGGQVGADPHQIQGRLYSELGRIFHLQERPYDDDVFREALRGAQLPEDLAEAAESADVESVLQASHDDGMRRVGLKVGTPIISVSGNSFFGPVVTPAPAGEKAGRLWDGVLLVSETDGFFELKRTRTRKPKFR
ncbi:disulfide bond formation protein DsbA [Actinomadura sp. CNU-125]|uniref:mycothiol-dependent nitroreductase Rv2466c family protein n=1 Tax=Actinomadura sp. CNU-125 TaxID=1904961 RepID=UPI000AC120CB|nr:disulfide bond formation protein DsbA [Actinomadura sp. CNU-125]